MSSRTTEISARTTEWCIVRLPVVMAVGGTLFTAARGVAVVAAEIADPMTK
jgi:hypothetical protein